jgi:RNA recognition motif-containing protein
MMDSSGDSSSAGEETDPVHQVSTAKQQRLLEPPTERRTSDLIVLGLPYRTTSAQLKAYFEQFGRVVVSEV